MKKFILLGAIVFSIGISVLLLVGKSHIAEGVPIWGSSPQYISEGVPIWGNSVQLSE